MKGWYRQAGWQTSAGDGPPAPSSSPAPPPGTRTPEAPDPPSPGWPGGEPPLRSLRRSLAAELLKHLGDIPVNTSIMTSMTSPFFEFGKYQIMTPLRTFIIYVSNRKVDLNGSKLLINDIIFGKTVLIFFRRQQKVWLQRHNLKEKTGTNRQHNGGPWTQHAMRSTLQPTFMNDPGGNIKN